MVDGGAAEGFLATSLCLGGSAGKRGGSNHDRTNENDRGGNVQENEECDHDTSLYGMHRHFYI